MLPYARFHRLITKGMSPVAPRSDNFTHQQYHGRECDDSGQIDPIRCPVCKGKRKVPYFGRCTMCDGGHKTILGCFKHQVYWALYN